MEKALELRQSLSRLDRPEERPSSTGHRFQPWTQESYCKRLFTFSPDRWTSRPRICESTEAALNGWICTGKDKISCEECSVKLYQPWLSDLEDELSAELACKYKEEFKSGHSPNCPWRSVTHNESLKYFIPDISHRSEQEIKSRIERLCCFKEVELEPPKDHTMDVPSTLAVSGWDRHDDCSVNCMFRCSTMIPVDSKFHPILEHRWCCPVVLLNSAQPEKSGWNGLLRIFQNLQ